QGGGISKITLENDWASALWQLRIKSVQLEVDVAELPLCIRNAFIELYGYERIARKRYGLNAIVRIRSRMNGLILGGNILNPTCNELFDLLRRRSRPRASRDSDTHGDFRVLSLRHGFIAEPTPNEDSGQKYPGDVRMLDENSWNVPAISFLRVFVCRFSIPLLENLNQIAVLELGGSNYNDLFARLHTFDRYVTLVGVT